MYTETPHTWPGQPYKYRTKVDNASVFNMYDDGADKGKEVNFALTLNSDHSKVLVTRTLMALNCLNSSCKIARLCMAPTCCTHDN